jgi:hypothetical protein
MPFTINNSCSRAMFCMRGGDYSNVFLMIMKENRKPATANRFYDLENARSHIDIGTWHGMGVEFWGSFV